MDDNLTPTRADVPREASDSVLEEFLECPYNVRAMAEEIVLLRERLALVPPTVADALAKARTEYMAALNRCNASLRPNQIALLDDFIATKREHITEDILAALREGGER